MKDINFKNGLEEVKEADHAHLEETSKREKEQAFVGLVKNEQTSADKLAEALEDSDLDLEDSDHESGRQKFNNAPVLNTFSFSLREDLKMTKL